MEWSGDELCLFLPGAENVMIYYYYYYYIYRTRGKIDVIFELFKSIKTIFGKSNPRNTTTIFKRATIHIHESCFFVKNYLKQV